MLFPRSAVQETALVMSGFRPDCPGSGGLFSWVFPSLSLLCGGVSLVRVGLGGVGGGGGGGWVVGWAVLVGSVSGCSVSVSLELAPRFEEGMFCLSSAA